MSDKTPFIRRTAQPLSSTQKSVLLQWQFYLSVGIAALAAVSFGVVLYFVVQTYNTASRLSPGVVSLTIGPSCQNESRSEIDRAQAYQVRLDAAFYHYSQPVPCHVNNGDISLPLYYASFSKGMPHDSLGHVDANAFALLLKALTTGQPSDFDAIPRGVGAVRMFTNPQAAFATVMEGGAPHSFYQLPPPNFNSAEAAGEIIENYWMALMRDVKFADYGTDPLAAAAVAELSALQDFRGPPVSAGTLFRGVSSGCLVGPYLSQFLYLPIPFGAMTIYQQLNPPTPGQDFMTTFSEYLRVQNGLAPAATMTYLGTERYMITGRDLAAFVHKDILFQAYFHAMLWLMANGAPLKPNIPYQTSELNQMGFATFGDPDIDYSVTHPAISALKAVWYQKWRVHLRLRPEAFGARIHNNKTGAYTYPLHSDLLNSAALTQTFSTYGTYLLPQAFPEGSPMHPSYGAGHATVAGACTAMLKAFYQEDWVLPNPMVPDATGANLVPYVGPPLTVGGELNKLANNIAIGRNIASVHWRSDARESLKLGEQVAIEILRDKKRTVNEPFGSFTFTGFEGNTVTV